MAKNAYLKELQKIRQNKAIAPPTTRTREELEADIAAITKELLGPLPNVVRLDLVEARTVLRKQLAAVSA